MFVTLTFDDIMPSYLDEPVAGRVAAAVELDAVEFARKRLGIEPDERQAEVLRSEAKRGILNCTRQWGKSTVAAVKAIRDTKNFAPLAASFKRIRNILEKSAGKGDKGQGAVKQELLRDAAELQLYTVVQKIGDEATRLKKEKKYRKALEKISELRPAVDFFFDKVLVMVEDEDIRRNRIALLGTLLKEFSNVADFSELGSEEAK